MGQGEKEEKEQDPKSDPKMVKEDAEGSDEYFLQVSSKTAKKKGDGFDGFGSPDPFNRNDDDEVDAGEPNAPLAEDPNSDPNMVKAGAEDSDDSFLQVSSKTAGEPIAKDDDDEVD